MPQRRPGRNWPGVRFAVVVAEKLADFVEVHTVANTVAVVVVAVAVVVVAVAAQALELQWIPLLDGSLSLD